MAVATPHALSATERSYPTSKVRGRSREDPMTEGQQPRGVTPRPRSGAGAESARLQRRRNGREELPKSKIRGGSREDLLHIRGKGGGREELPHTPGQGWHREYQPHVQRVVAARAQEGLKALSHIEGQEG